MDNSSNMLQLCRLCLVKDDVNIPIFEEQGDIRQIFLKISSCLPVKVSQDDRLPKKICDGCSYKLDMLYEFWNSSANAEKQLLTWLGEAGMTSQMTDGTISAVAQQIKPADALVKQETIDPPDINHSDDDEDDDKTYMFNKQEEKVSKNNIDEPPPKRQRRTAAVKAAIAMDQNSDDDDDSGEPMTKMEDDSDDSDNDDHEPAFVDVPSTSADDQPGPSGMGKDGVDAPAHKMKVATDIKPNKVKIVRLVMPRRRIITTNNTDIGKKPQSACMDVEQYEHNIIKIEDEDISDDNIEINDMIETHIEEGDDYAAKENNIESIDSTLTCRKCNQVFLNKETLTAHLLSLQYRAYTCELCQKKFKHVKNLDQHRVRVHSDIRFSCDICTEVFTEKSMLKYHKFKKHRHLHKLPSEVVKQFKETNMVITCEYCKRGFFTRRVYNLHLKTEHAIYIID